MKIRGEMLSVVFGAMAIGLVACGGGAPDAKVPDGASVAGGPAAAEPKASGPNDLGDLEYKRMQDNIKEGFPKFKARFKELCGTDVDLDVDWASLGRDKATLETFWGNYGMERLVSSFESVCHDKSGKDAVQKKVKKIRAVNVKDAAKVKITISGGTMTGELNWSGSSPGMNENEIGAAITKQL
ncbi:MAG: hypothetical protein JST00_03385 [Deltaproteobacteria bacterium]|nr:hypothetical protein [Deltaproteobacteria bacterium]